MFFLACLCINSYEARIKVFETYGDIEKSASISNDARVSSMDIHLT